MSMISPISAASSSMQWSMQDMAASADNIANLQTAKPTDGPAYQGAHAVQTENPEGGVLIDLVEAGTEEGIVLREPTHPDADASGEVRYPDINVGEELIRMQMAQRNVEAQVVTVEAAVDSYRSLLAMTNRDRDHLTATAG
jgi:flagellar basal-body rod protein FlgC